jgi:hypothetical protein
MKFKSRRGRTPVELPLKSVSSRGPSVPALMCVHTIGAGLCQSRDLIFTNQLFFFFRPFPFLLLLFHERSGRSLRRINIKHTSIHTSSCLTAVSLDFSFFRPATPKKILFYSTMTFDYFFCCWHFSDFISVRNVKRNFFGIGRQKSQYDSTLLSFFLFINLYLIHTE